jgi:hypothetical protein
MAHGLTGVGTCRSVMAFRVEQPIGTLRDFPIMAGACQRRPPNGPKIRLQSDLRPPRSLSLLSKQREESRYPRRSRCQRRVGTPDNG